MKLGLVSAIYDDVDYEKLIDLVADAGLECVEVFLMMATEQSSASSPR